MLYSGVSHQIYNLEKSHAQITFCKILSLSSELPSEKWGLTWKNNAFSPRLLCPVLTSDISLTQYNSVTMSIAPTEEFTLSHTHIHNVYHRFYWFQNMPVMTTQKWNQKRGKKLFAARLLCLSCGKTASLSNIFRQVKSLWNIAKHFFHNICIEESQEEDIKEGIDSRCSKEQVRHHAKTS